MSKKEAEDAPGSQPLPPMHLKLLCGRTDEEKFAGLLLVAKAYGERQPEEDELKVIFESVGGTFLLRLLKTGVEGGKGMYAHVCLRVLNVLAISDAVASELGSFLPLLLTFIKQETAKQVKLCSSPEKDPDKSDAGGEIRANSPAATSSAVSSSSPLADDAVTLWTRIASASGLVNERDIKGVVEFLCIEDGNISGDFKRKVLRVFNACLSQGSASVTTISNDDRLALSKVFFKSNDLLKFELLETLLCFAQSFDSSPSSSNAAPEVWSLFVRAGIRDILRSRVVEGLKRVAILLSCSMIGAFGELWCVYPYPKGMGLPSVEDEKKGEFVQLLLNTTTVELSLILMVESVPADFQSTLVKLKEEAVEELRRQKEERKNIFEGDGDDDDDEDTETTDSTVGVVEEVEDEEERKLNVKQQDPKNEKPLAHILVPHAQCVDACIQIVEFTIGFLVESRLEGAMGKYQWARLPSDALLLLKRRYDESVACIVHYLKELHDMGRRSDPLGAVCVRALGIWYLEDPSIAVDDLKCVIPAIMSLQSVEYESEHIHPLSLCSRAFSEMALDPDLFTVLLQNSVVKTASDIVEDMVSRSSRGSSQGSGLDVGFLCSPRPNKLAVTPIWKMVDCLDLLRNVAFIEPMTVFQPASSASLNILPAPEFLTLAGKLVPYFQLCLQAVQGASESFGSLPLGERGISGIAALQLLMGELMSFLLVIARSCSPTAWKSALEATNSSVAGFWNVVRLWTSNAVLVEGDLSPSMKRMILACIEDCVQSGPNQHVAAVPVFKSKSFIGYLREAINTHHSDESLKEWTDACFSLVILLSK